jgi:hypothetical protein
VSDLTISNVCPAVSNVCPEVYLLNINALHSKKPRLHKHTFFPKYQVSAEKIGRYADSVLTIRGKILQKKSPPVMAGMIVIDAVITPG